MTGETLTIEDRLITLRQAATLLGVDYDTVHRWALKGVFGRVVRVGPCGSLRLYESDVRAQISIEHIE